MWPAGTPGRTPALPPLQPFIHTGSKYDASRSSTKTGTEGGREREICKFYISEMKSRNLSREREREADRLREREKEILTPLSNKRRKREKERNRE